MQQGRALSTDVKKLVVALKLYFDRTRGDLDEQDCRSEVKVSHALGLGVVTVQRLMARHKKDPELLESQPGERGRPPRVVSEASEAIVRAYVREANHAGRHITLENLYEYLQKSAPSSEFAHRTLGRALDRWGFTFGKGKRSQHLKEKDYVVASRRRYLRKKRGNRRGAETMRPEVYLDESYVNKNHSSDFTWYRNDDGPAVKKPTGKGEQLIILNAITAKGWVPGARVVFKASKKTGDYHGQVNQELFTAWFSDKLLPNIPKGSLIILDNAAYHNYLAASSAPIATSKKESIRAWLQANGVPVSDDCLKSEMAELLNKLAPAPTYAIDVLAEAHGHAVLRTPPYHPELQPIEVCWGVVKNHLGRHCDFTMTNLLSELDKAFAAVTHKTCAGLIAKIRNTEDQFWSEDALQEEDGSQLEEEED